ncbi:MAG TPA: ATP-binding protein [Thermomicrobiales bacterium]|jgi:signal transduction histidine kinase|nr:ATP-binding protein [Thermomicrobiales bacterium]
MLDTATDRDEIDRRFPPAERFQAMVAAFEIGYCLIELLLDKTGPPVDYWFIEVSPAFRDLTGLENPVGRRISEIAPAHEQFFLDQFNSVARTGRAIQFTRSAAAVGGRTFEVRACRIGDTGSRVVGVWFSDVSEQVSFDQRHRDYIAMVSHDLGTPMTVVRAQAQMLQRRQAYEAHRVDRIVHQIDRMERLLSGLRNVVRAEKGWLERGVVAIDLARLVTDAADRGQLQSPAHQVMVEIDGPAVGYWDQERIEQILDNLISNAIKYSPAGRSITVRLTSNDTSVRISVADQGIGIPADSLPLLFERFYRASEGGAVKGMGLGLYIVRTLVQAKGGRVSVESVVGKGSTFTVELPRRTAPPVAESPTGADLADKHPSGPPTPSISEIEYFTDEG